MKNKPIKIVHLISSLKIGGAEMLLIHLINELAKSGYQQEVMYFHDGPMRHELSLNNQSVHQIKGFFFRYDPIFFYRLISALRRSRPSVIHASLWAASFFGRCIAWLFSMPIICAVHAQPAHGGQFRLWCDWITARFAQQVVAVSPSIATSLVKNRLARCEHITVIQNGIDSSAFAQRAFNERKERTQFDFDQSHFLIGAVGRLVPVKNYPLLFKAVALLLPDYPQVRLLMVGSGPEEQKLRAMAHQLGISLYVCFVSGTQLAYGYYSLFDCFVQPSFTEGLSMALLEAMSSSLACVVSAIDQHPVIKNSRNGLIIRPDDVQSLMGAVSRLINDHELRLALAKQAYEDAAKKFSLKKTCKSYQSIFKLNSKRAHFTQILKNS